MPANNKEHIHHHTDSVNFLFFFGSADFALCELDMVDVNVVVSTAPPAVVLVLLDSLEDPSSEPELTSSAGMAL